MKIGQYLAKIWTRVYCAFFWATVYIYAEFFRRVDKIAQTPRKRLSVCLSVCLSVSRSHHPKRHPDHALLYRPTEWTDQPTDRQI